MLMQEPELEEGEACYKDGDKSFDLDTAFSYIGDKLQSLLGHHQKDFEGGYSAKNLGAKYGAYGSFLPMYQRSPPILLQPKSPKRVQEPPLLRSPQVYAPSSVNVSNGPSLRNDDPSPGVGTSQTLRNSYVDALVAPKEPLSSHKVAGAFPEKVERPTGDLGNAPDQKPLKVLIKMGPGQVAQYNAEIYNLGLTSSSSSDGDSHNESDGLMLESHEISNESPSGILEIMTSPLATGGFMLSPLNENLINLPREPEHLVESTHEAVPSTSTISDRIPYVREKEVKKNKKIKKPQDEFAMNLNDARQKIINGDDIEHSLHPLHEFPGNALSNAARESGKDAKVKNSKGNKEKVKGRAVSGDVVNDTSLEHVSNQSCGKSVPPESRYDSVEKVVKHMTKISKKDVSGDYDQWCRTLDAQNCASSIVCSDNSEGAGFKGAMDRSISKVGPNSTFDKCDGIGKFPASNRLSLDAKNKSKESQPSVKLALKSGNLRDIGSAIPERMGSGKKDVRKLHLSQKDVVPTRLEQLDNPKPPMEGSSSSGKPKYFTSNAAKAKPAFADKVKQKSSNQKYFDKVKPEMQTVNLAVAPVDTALAEPVVILDNWVGCDRCQKWRLLPYGKQSNQLPDKWICSMLDWLPGMNRCDVSEDETTKAVQGLYLVPFPENQHNFQSLANGATGEAITAGVHNLNQKTQNHGYDLLNKQKLKEKQNAASMSDPGSFKGKKNLKQKIMKDGASRKVQAPLDVANKNNRSDMLLPDQSAKIVSKSNKRKSEHATEDYANPRKKTKEKSTQIVEGKVNATKSTRVGNGNVSSNGLDLECDLPSKTMKDMKNSEQKDATFGRVGAFEETQDLLGKGPVGSKARNGGEASTKRVKLKDYVDNQQPLETWQNNGSNIHDGKSSIQVDCNDVYLHKNKKPRVSQDDKELKINQDHDLSKRKCEEPGTRLSVSKVRNIEKKEKVSKQSQKQHLTVEDIEKLKKDLGCEQLSMMATSSSSKVSDSRKNKVSHTGVRGSPEDSVSSYPVRTTYLNEPTSMLTDKMRKADPKINNGSTTGRVNKIKDRDEDDRTLKHEVSSNERHNFSEDSSMKPVKPDMCAGMGDIGKSNDSRKKNRSDQREHDKNDQKLIHPGSAGVTQEKLTEKFPGNSTDQTVRKLHGSSSQGNEQGALSSNKLGSRSLGPMKKYHDVSLVDDTSKAVQGTAVVRLQNGTGKCDNNEAEQSMILNASLGSKKTRGGASYTTLKEAEDVWREAEELRAHADLIKNAGFTSESNYEYFKAALKFFHGASLFESCSGESIKHLEKSPMQMYSAAAKLFRTCASEHEKGNEMAAAALAYKCVEVSYMRVVYCKSSTTNRVLHDLQSNLKMVPQGESPSSSASDVDNLNNLPTADKAILPKGSGSHSGNHLILPRSRPNFVRLLDFTKDVNCAMEAAKKSQETFSAALTELGETQNTEAIITLKRVVEFSFQNVEELVRLVLHAFNTINSQGIGGNGS